MIKAVIFDFDDTLVQSQVQKWAHHKHVAKKFYDIDLTDEVLREHWGKPLDLLVSELYQRKDTLENMYTALISVRDDFLKQPYQGAVQVTRKILVSGMKVGVLSATNKKYLHEDLIRCGFPVKELSIIQGADETKVHKPDPKVFDPILYRLKKEGIKKEETMYVGDSLYDLTAAKGADIQFVAVTTGLHSKEDFKKHGAENIIKDLTELPELIKKL